jgi:hypothetical protein
MEKLELKYLSPYLPYGLKWDIEHEKYSNRRTMIGATPNSIIFELDEDEIIDYYTLSYSGADGMKPILRPLSDLTKEITVDGKKIIVSDETAVGFAHGREYRSIGIVQNRLTTNTITYDDMVILLSYHFDVFGLIDKGLAIDINTLEK